MLSNILILVQTFGLCYGAFGSWGGESTPNNQENNKSNSRNDTNQQNFANELREKLAEAREREKIPGWGKRDSEDGSSSWDTRARKKSKQDSG